MDENDAPESVQDIGPTLPWASFPDLLVPTNSSSACLEEDQPESQLSFTQRVRQSAEASGHHHHHHHHSQASSSSNSGSSHRANGRETGAIPKRERIAPPPDVSIAANASQSLISNDLLNSSNSAPSVAQRLTLSNSANRSDHQISDQSRVHELENNMISLQTQKAVLEQQLHQKDNEIRSILDNSSGQQPAVVASLAGLSASVSSLTQAMDRMARDVTDRLDRLESRLNVLTVTGSSGSVVSLDATAALREELRSLSEQQRRVSYLKELNRIKLIKICSTSGNGKRKNILFIGTFRRLARCN